MEKNKIIGIVVIAIIVFFLNPLAGIVLASIYAISKNSNILLLSFIILVSVFLGIINTTKVLESDIVGYSNAFDLAKNQKLIPYLREFGKEPVYYSVMYFFSNILNANFKFFVFIQTFAAYLFYLTSVRKFQQKIVNSRISIIFAICLAFLFFELFSLSAHLMRQFLAASILLFYIVEKLFYFHNRWLLLILAIFIHSTALLFIPLLFLPVLKRKLTIGKLILVISVFSLIVTIIPVISSFILGKLGLGMFTYVFHRSLGGTYDDGVNVALVTIFINILLLLYGIYRNYLYKKTELTEIHFNHIIIFFTIFILVMINQPLLAYRFSFYSYFIFPMIVSVIVSKKSTGVLFPVIASLVTVFLTIRFGYKLENGVFEYLSLKELISLNIFSLIL